MISGNLGHNARGFNILWTMYFMETLLLSAPRTILLMWQVHNTCKKGRFNWLTENFLKLGCELIHHWSSNQQSLRGTATSRPSLTKLFPVTARIFNFDSIIREETWVRGLGEGSEIGRPVPSHHAARYGDVWRMLQREYKCRSFGHMAEQQHDWFPLWCKTQFPSYRD